MDQSACYHLSDTPEGLLDRQQRPGEDAVDILEYLSQHFDVCDSLAQIHSVGHGPDQRKVREDVGSSRLEGSGWQTILTVLWTCRSNGSNTTSSPNPLRFRRKPSAKKDGATQKSRYTCKISSHWSAEARQEDPGAYRSGPERLMFTVE